MSYDSNKIPKHSINKFKFGIYISQNSRSDELYKEISEKYFNPSLTKN